MMVVMKQAITILSFTYFQRMINHKIQIFKLVFTFIDMKNIIETSLPVIHCNCPNCSKVFNKSKEVRIFFSSFQWE